MKKNSTSIERNNMNRRFYILPLLLITMLLLWQTGCSTNSTNKHFSDSVSGVNVFFSPSAKKVKSAAILPFKAPTELIGSSVSDLFVSEFMRMNAFDLIERSQMSGVMGEAELSMEGVSDSKAMQVGQMTGADGVIIGTVTEYDMVAYKGKKYPSVGITIRMIDCTTGKIIWSADYAERANKKGMSLAVYTRNVVHDITTSLYSGICHNKANHTNNKIVESFSAYPPEDIKISNQGLREVIITWKPAKWNGQYIIKRSTTPNGSFRQIAYTAPTRGKYIDRANNQNHITDSTTYYYKIFPKNITTGDIGEPSPTISSTTAPPPPPVTGIKAISGLVRSIPITWNQVAGSAITGYIIKRSSNPSGPFVTIKKIKGSIITNWQDGGKEPGKLKDSETFFYKIFAINRVGATSLSSETVNAITRSIPPTIKELEAKSNLPREISISWQLSTDEKVVGYTIERALSDGEFKRVKIIKDKTINKWLDKGGISTGLGRLKNGTTYRYRISSFNTAKANSRWSDIAIAVTKPIPAQPNAPVLSHKTPAFIDLKWSPNPEDDIDKYLIEYRKQGSSSFKKAATINVTMGNMVDDILSAHIDGLNNGTTYEFRISAVDTDTLQSQWSSTAQATTKPIPDPPTNITFSKLDTSGIELKWEAPEQTDITKYRIFHKGILSNKVITETENCSCTLPPESMTKKWTIIITTLDIDNLESKASHPLKIQ